MRYNKKTDEAEARGNTFPAEIPRFPIDKAEREDILKAAEFVIRQAENF